MIVFAVYHVIDPLESLTRLTAGVNDSSQLFSDLEVDKEAKGQNCELEFEGGRILWRRANGLMRRWV